MPETIIHQPSVVESLGKMEYAHGPKGVPLRIIGQTENGSKINPYLLAIVPLALMVCCLSIYGAYIFSK